MSELFATEVDLPAPAEEVFRHLTDPAAMVRWMDQHATLRPVPGGRVGLSGGEECRMRRLCAGGGPGPLGVPARPAPPWR